MAVQWSGQYHENPLTTSWLSGARSCVVTLQHLRHTYATRCYENGVDQQVVQKLLGHSTLAMTTDLYTHVSEEKKKEEVAELKILD